MGVEATLGGTWGCFVERGFDATRAPCLMNANAAGGSRLLESVFSREGCFGVPQHKNTMLVDQAPQSRHGKQPRLWMKVDQKIAAEYGVVRSFIIQKIGCDQIPLPEL
jgi:hypothetical protein